MHGNSVMEAIASIFAGITGVAVLAVILSKNSNTAGVINATGSAYQGSLAVALSPITGTGFTGNNAGQSPYGAAYGGINTSTLY